MRNEAALLLASGASLACLLVPGLAAAQLRSDWSVNRATQEEWDGGYDLKAERRSGFAGSISTGLGLGAASGYPNEIEKLNEREFRSSTGLGLGSLTTAWLGGALRDWFVFGLGLYWVGAESGDLEAKGTGFLVHVETFPLWSLGGAFRDLGVHANLGPGSLTIKGGPEDADGGLMSTLGLGVSFEALRFSAIALGPTLDGVYTYSEYAKGGGVFLGVKGAVYGGP